MNPSQLCGAQAHGTRTHEAQPHERQAPEALDGSCFADIAAAQRALGLVQPMLDAALKDSCICGTGCLCVVIMDPALPPHSHTPFDQAVLLEADYGREHWDADYSAFARSKAQCAWLHQADAAMVQLLHPQLLRTGDSLLRGGVFRDGIVVGVSGALPFYDEAFAIAIAAALRAQAAMAAHNALAAGVSTATSAAT